MMRKKLGLTAAAVLCAGITGLCVHAALMGDADNDGKRGVGDIRKVQDFLLGKNKTISAIADMNADQVIDGFDLAILKRKVRLGDTGESGSSIPDYGTEPNVNATMFEDFRDNEAEYFFASDGWTNGNPFDCVWTEDNTSLSDGALHLTIDKDYSGKYNYTGAEYRTSDHYHYGYYETSMKAIKNNGVVSSFFTYTGPSEDNPWDEIDIEILGKDTTKVQLNYYTNGVGNHEYMYDLGFDASLAYHTYGFDWQPDHITWYVDGKPVYTAYSNIPSTPGRIMMNTWPGTGVNEWLAPFDGRTPLTAYYEWVTYNKQ